MDERDFPRTRDAIERTERTGNQLLRGLAAQSGGRLHEIHPGVWVESKLEPKASKGGLMGVGELALRLGVSPERARTISRRKGFPEATRLSLGRVWSAEDIEAWIREWIKD